MWISAWQAASVPLIASLHMACARHPQPTPTVRTQSMDVTGVLQVDGHPVGEAAIALVADDGRTVAAGHSDAGGRFALPAGAAFQSGWVVAKLHAPVVGAIAAPVAADRAPITLAVSTSAAVTLTVDIDPPQAADPVRWFDVTVTPTSQDGVPAAALRALTLDGIGPARSNAYHKLRVTGLTSRLRVLPGTYDVRVAHVVEDSKRIPPVPSNWVSARATLEDGRVVVADLEHLSVNVRRDVEMRVAMVTVRE